MNQGVNVEPSLKAMMLRGLAGDARAYCDLLGALAGYLRAYFCRRLPPGCADLEDLVQGALLVIHIKRETFDPALPFTSWAYALARYKLLDHFRETRTRPSLSIDSVDDLFSAQNPEVGADRDELQKLLARLPRRQRALLVAVKVRGLSMAEAGANVDSTASTVRVSIYRALRALTQKIRDENR